MGNKTVIALTAVISFAAGYGTKWAKDRFFGNNNDEAGPAEEEKPAE